ncbi:class I SAM-dependent methyltransferase [Lederbergia galactosidilytica]|uniref:Methyltransferase n=2 Tax=Lederbergia galactosidilytica TaxID=217031 RepID=A0A177ZKU7_9BACI|nr:class I SAM-dependent methyltransferase [Lederbergia galactosidilytica]MBP1916099.1 2-polyprenyl-3-methyl-5-hydroxy-6-metoxy-1,4-benzoquinol methylase [Lederbergia galactosidilytica]OAK68445.1 methyltransferase [Lederbergia galactosidilytica]
MDRIQYIRNEEKKYHDFCYENYLLFAEGSWLNKPAQTVIDLLPLLNQNDRLTVLDLGCGVGRNSIPIAEAIKTQNGRVICVDLLDSALNKLREYCREYQVEEVIQTEKADISNYKITANNFDFIIAVSSLEHIHSEETFHKVVQQMAEGTKSNGINCLIINSEVQEIDLENNQQLEALMELNLPTEVMMNKLSGIYANWEVLQSIVKPLKYKITRDEKPILLKTRAITYVVRRNELNNLCCTK